MPESWGAVTAASCTATILTACIMETTALQLDKIAADLASETALTLATMSHWTLKQNIIYAARCMCAGLFLQIEIGVQNFVVGEFFYMTGASSVSHSRIFLAQYPPRVANLAQLHKSQLHAVRAFSSVSDAPLLPCRIE